MPSRHTLLVASTITLLLGYADLVRGGITIAPLLLVLAYFVLIPAAIWRMAPGAPPRNLKPNDTPRPSYLIAGIVSAAIFALYLFTLAPSTAMWDTSEYMTAAYTLGIPHPPGNPLFVLLGRVFAILPIATTVAVRINILAAFSSAVSAGMWFLIAERVLATWLPTRWPRILGATMAAVIGATAFTVWNQSVVNEKVYTVSLIGLAVVSWLAIRWIDEAERLGADRLLVMIAYLSGLGYANHMAGVLPLPAVALAVLMRRPRTLGRVRLILVGAVALLIGGSPFATQPIRAAFSPPINEGEVTACREGLKFSCTFSKGTYDAFMYNFNREQYGKPSLDVRQAPISAQVGMWWLYFKWQWFRDLHMEHQRIQGALAAIFLALGLLGGWVHWRKDRRSFWYFGPFLFTITLVLIYYLNFKYGGSQAPELGGTVEREVRDRDYFYLWSFSAWGVWAALGLVYCWQALAEFRRSRVAEPSPRQRRRAMLLSAPVLLIALVPLTANWSTASRKGDQVTLAFAHDLLNSVEPYGVLVTYGDNDTFPLWYAQEVEGIRKDVTVAVLSLLNTDWFIRGIIRRPVFQYDAARGPAVYRSQAWKKPSGPPVALTMKEADSIPEFIVLREPANFSKGGLSVTIDPRALPQYGSEGGILMRADILVLRMIADSWPERPIYIARTTGDYGQRLGLGAHLISQGLANKLFIPPAKPDASMVYIEGGGWFDVTRSQALWKNVFQGPKAIQQLSDWVDRPSVSIPFSYLLAGSDLAHVLGAQGATSQSAAILDTVRGVARAVRVEQLLTPSEATGVDGRR